MGQSKIKNKLYEIDERKLLSSDIAGVSAAIIKLAKASSEKLGHDCHLHADMGRALLSDLGVNTTVCAGYAAWRVGQGDNDVILHANLKNQTAATGSMHYHVWLMCGRYIIDFTTYQLELKAKILEGYDGIKTNVDWCPPFLLTPIQESKTLHDVVKLNTGMFNYTRNLDIEKYIFSKVKGLDEDDLLILRTIYQKPDMQVYGGLNR